MRVLVRVDYNVPLKEGKVVNNERIKQTLPTIRWLLEQECRVVLMSHLGRPKGKVVEELRMNPVAEELSKLLGKKVLKLDDCIGADVESAVASMGKGEVVLLENTRFHPEEKANDPEFSKRLAELGEVFVFEAFGTAHRNDASTVGVQAHFNERYIGFLVEREIEGITKVLQAIESKRPFVLVLGGKKISDKLGVIQYMSKHADYILIGGAMGFPILKAQGKPIGKSYCEEEAIPIVKAQNLEQVPALSLPLDYLVGETLDATSAKSVSSEEIPGDRIALDIGEETIRHYTEIIRRAGTVIWNGPMGYFENPVFARGTIAVGKAVAQAPVSLIGGGDTISAIEQHLKEYKSKYSHVSTGGGALLELLSGRPLVALNQ
ncbi:phosphoglycerate kinase [Candidatus Woesearchaeota archaeon]|nr:phosphoglycerate kinase [Candidatus Woesearchaeota archaeon]RLE43127.1 MAG: phosphoglycerate kinase [Candidatus Woesearchaeota archaeon]